MAPNIKQQIDLNIVILLYLCRLHHNTTKIFEVPPIHQPGIVLWLQLIAESWEPEY